MLRRRAVSEGPQWTTRKKAKRAIESAEHDHEKSFERSVEYAYNCCPAPEAGDELCEKSEFCARVRKFDVYSTQSPSGPSRTLKYRFLKYLGGGKYFIGIKREIIQRAACPFCRYVARFLDDLHEGCAIYFENHLKSAKLLYLQVPMEMQYIDETCRGSESGLTVIEHGPRVDADAARLFGPQIDLRYLKRWISLCSRLHGTVCPPPEQHWKLRSDIPECLRVIDVELQCMVDIPWSQRYIALSYVWGSASPVRLLSKDLKASYQEGWWASQKAKIPRTISDLMVLAKGLDIRYIWVDSMCLVQDSAMDLAAGIRNMDVVYEGSALTVMAAGGAGADSGLPGINGTPRAKSQEVVVLKTDLALLFFRELKVHLREALLTSRGWTLQEQYLSRRLLIFVNGQVYFHCRSTKWSEELWSDVDPKVDVGRFIQWEDELEYARNSFDQDPTDHQAFHYFFEAVRCFQRRNLSQENDAINAMMGIIQRSAQKMGWRMSEGMPLEIMPAALTFNAIDYNAVRRRKEFPSWSWAGWKDWIGWYNELHHVHPVEQDSQLRDTLSEIHPCESLTEASAWLQRADTHKNLDTARDAFEDLMGCPSKPGRSLPDAAVRPMAFRPYTVLLISAAVVTVETRDFCLSSMYDDPKAYIISDVEGNLPMARLTASGPDGSDCGFVYPDSRIESSDICDREVTLVIIRKCINSRLIWEEEIYSLGSDLVWALAVVQMADGVFERRGLAQLHRSAVHKLNPSWRKVVLG